MVVLTVMPHPLKKLYKKQLNKISKPWINKYILKIVHHRDRLFKEKEKILLTYLSNDIIIFFVTVSQEKSRKQNGNITMNTLMLI